MFKLDQQLIDDTVEVIELSICKVLLMKDRRFPWLVLVPQVGHAVEIMDLKRVERATLMEDVAKASKILKDVFKPDKINVGSLGNIVTQLHVHVIGRFKNDGAWPGPVWGSGKPIPYSVAELETLREKLREGFNGLIKTRARTARAAGSVEAVRPDDGTVGRTDVIDNDNNGAGSPQDDGK